MADTTAAMFDAAILKKIDEAIAEVEKKVPIFDKDGKRLWFRDKVSKGFTLTEVMQKLKEVNYDFTTAGTYLDNAYNSRMKSQKAIEEIAKLKEESEKKSGAEKTGAKLSWIVSAFTIAGVGAFSSYMIKKSVGDVPPDLTAAAMPGANILPSIMKGGWIIAGASGGVGLLLLAFYIIEKYAKTTKKEESEQGTLSLKAEEQKALQESQKKEIEAEILRKTQ